LLQNQFLRLYGRQLKNRTKYFNTGMKSTNLAEISGTGKCFAAHPVRPSAPSVFFGVGVFYLRFGAAAIAENPGIKHIPTTAPLVAESRCPTFVDACRSKRRSFTDVALWAAEGI
jgi:hypothetical protein